MFGRTLAQMPTAFDGAFRRVNEIVVSSLWLEFIGAQRRRYTNRCDGLDRQIDALVYDLYVLTLAEIKIVEGAVNLEIKKKYTTG
jgi:hypothetical protein